MLISEHLEQHYSQLAEFWDVLASPNNNVEF